MKKWIGLLALLMLALVCATALGETNTQVKHYLMLGEDGISVLQEGVSVPGWELLDGLLFAD